LHNKLYIFKKKRKEKKVISCDATTMIDNIL
jgi:hypothetical protein